jgi:hypothetical protein
MQVVEFLKYKAHKSAVVDTADLINNQCNVQGMMHNYCDP